MIYSQIVILRITLSWFIYINPYTVPWSYLVAAVDWTEEILQGIVPAILGVNMTGSIFLGILGVIADSLNHLVFTMPLPILWYRYPIPNEIREYWYKERPEILDYMQKAYQDLDIQFLPDSLLQELNQQKLQADLSQIDHSLIKTNTYLNEIISTEILSKNNLIQGNELISYIHSIHEHFHNFWM